MSLNLSAPPTFEMTPEEEVHYRERGYIVREASFTRAECAEVAGECEALLAALAARQSSRTVRSGSHVIDVLDDMDLSIKWERDYPDQIRGIEPFAHVCPPLDRWAHDRRLLDPCLFACGADAVDLFTEKLHTKRARSGGEIEAHQDFPYWEPFAPQAAQVVTAMVYLDDATVANGCLEVAPGSHRSGKRPTRVGASGIDALRMDPAKFDTAELMAVEAPAGSILFFDAFLVHRSAPNRSAKDRRALLFSYQPAGLLHARNMKPPRAKR